MIDASGARLSRKICALTAGTPNVPSMVVNRLKGKKPKINNTLIFVDSTPNGRLDFRTIIVFNFRFNFNSDLDVEAW